MGVTVRQKEKGKGKPWWVFIAHNGKRKSIRVGDKTAAEALASKIREKLKTGELQITTEKRVPTFGEYAKKWLEGYAQTHLKYSTYVSYDGMLRNHLVALMETPIDQIKRTDLKELISAKMREGLAAKTVKNVKAIVSSILSHAFEDELIQAHPGLRLGKLVKDKDRKADVNPLTRDESRDFLEAVAANYSRYYPFFLCALRTGMRLGELRGLEWEDIDFREGFIEIKRSYTKGRFTTPKNGKGRRVDMSRQLSEILKKLRTERKAEALAKGWKDVPELVFVNEEGNVIDDVNLRKRVFNKALEKAGMRRIRLHDLRHTFASLLIQNGESLAYVKDQLGHHSIQITVDIYGHLVPGANRQAVDRLDEDFSSTYGQKAGCR